MAKNWHKVVVNGVAIYRQSASRAYVSYNVASGSWSSKMLPGNIPCEQLAKAPKLIKVKGSAWGVEIVRSYLEGERPVTHILAYRGKASRFSWELFKKNNPGAELSVTREIEEKPENREPADPNYVRAGWHPYTGSDRKAALEELASAKARIGKKLERWEGAVEYNDVMIVELK